ncbi:hypothetical protein C2G38_2209449 [Gigaspora rosea]|uniref:Uncharacterized protein n=1 Tax=Gigaspora rosea TaxID=44941 RepID=A0A397UKD4_9GLOM|nr:hypothetical protein C2G38_2209449 [Gigaspora rosea]
MRPQIMHSLSTYQRPKVHTLKCIFADFVECYKAFRLRPCETSELQTWRHADSANIAKNLLKYYDYIPELAECQSSLTKYSIYIASHVDLAVELDQTKRLLESVQVENRQKSQEIMTLNNQIVQMQQHIDNQKDEIEMLRGQLQKAHDDIIEIQNLYSEQYKYKETLIEQ